MRHARFSTLLLLAMLAGCARQAPEAAPSPPPEAPAAPPAVSPAPVEGKPLTFAVIPKQLDNVVFSYARSAAEKQARELGVELKWDAPAQSDEAKQADIFETFVQQGVDGIAVSCINPEVMRRVIDKAVEAGIPVVTWDSDSPDSKRSAFYGINDLQTGRLLGEELAALLPQGGKVALLSGVQGAQNLEQRLRGATEVLQANPKVKLLEPVYCNDDIHKSVQLISDVMAANPDLAGWVMVGGWPLFATDGLKAIKPGVTKVVAVDPLPEAQHWIELGYVQVCVGQKIFGWGSESLRLLYALANRQPLPNADPQGFVDSGVDIVVREKSGRYAAARYTALADYARQFAAATPAQP